MSVREEIHQTISRLTQLLHQHHGTETLPASTQAHLQGLQQAAGNEPDLLAPVPTAVEGNDSESITPTATD